MNFSGNGVLNSQSLKRSVFNNYKNKCIIDGREVEHFIDSKNNLYFVLVKPHFYIVSLFLM